MAFQMVFPNRKLFQLMSNLGRADYDCLKVEFDVAPHK